MTGVGVSLRRVRCPTCRTEIPYLISDPHRPFCSERCKGNDFGAWAAQAYRLQPREDGEEPRGVGSNDND